EPRGTTSRRGRKRGGASALDSRGAHRRLLKRKKIHRAGCAFVPRACWLSACAYSPQARLRSTRAPCSVQGGHYAVRAPRSRGGTPKGCSLHIFLFDPCRRAIPAACSKGLGPKNSPSRLRFRPPNRLTFRFRVRPPDSASTYSRSVLGAGENLDRTDMALQGPGGEKSPQFASGTTLSERARPRQ